MKINKNKLISIIQNTETFINPKIELEQYCIDATSAVDIIYFAGFEYNDVTKRFIIDLGSGTGRLSISSAFLKPKCVLSIDIDYDALFILKKNINILKLENLVSPICADIGCLEFSRNLTDKDKKITTIMNPPFGVKKRAADRIFLEKAFSFSNVVYSIHLAGEKVLHFIRKFCEKHDWYVDNFFPYKIILEKSFQFHTKKLHAIDVNVFRFLKK